MMNMNTKGDAQDLLMYIYSSINESVIDVDESGDLVYNRLRPMCVVNFITVDGSAWSVLNTTSTDSRTFESFKKWCSRQIKSIECGRTEIKIVHLSISSRDDELMKPWNDGNGVDLSGYLSNS